MSMSKRAIEPGAKVIIIDDFMRGGGSVIGISDMIAEFGGSIIGTGIAIVGLKPEKKKIEKYTSIVYLGDVSLEDRLITVLPNDEIFCENNI